MSQHTPGTRFKCDNRRLNASDPLCPLHDAAPEMRLLLETYPVVSLSGDQYTRFCAWSEAVSRLLAKIKGA